MHVVLLVVLCFRTLVIHQGKAVPVMAHSVMGTSIIEDELERN